MTFDAFVRNWTRIYKPMQHNEKKGNKRFFVTDGLKGLVDFVTEATNALSPCVVMESNLSGTVDDSRAIYDHVLYFFVHADEREMADGQSAANAKKKAVEHMLEFVKYLRAAKEDGEAEVRGVSNDPIPFDSEGPEQNGWYACRIDIEQVVMLDTCINQAKYI